jgi:hypothetical protein
MSFHRKYNVEEVMLNTTLNDISVISRRSVLLVDEPGVKPETEHGCIIILANLFAMQVTKCLF